MKKIKILIFTLLMFAFPLTANALSGTFNISCGNDTVTAGSTVQCDVTATSDGIITGLSSKVAIDGAATVSGFDRDTSLWMDTEGSLKNDGVTFFTSASGNGSSGNFNIGTLSLKIADDAEPGDITVSLTNIQVCDENDNDYTTGFTGGSATITVGSGSTPEPTGTGLKTLVCSSGGVISPQLSDANNGYSLFLNSADTNKFSITAEPKNSNHTVEFIDNDTKETLDPSNITFKTTSGRSDMLIIINVGTGDSKVSYYVSVVKPNPKVGELGSLTVGGKEIQLYGGKYDYSVTLEEGTSFKIAAELFNSNDFLISNSSDVLNKTFTAPGDYNIVISPKNNSSGYVSNTYIIHVSYNSSSGNVTPSNPTVNPKTGTTGAIFMAIVLVISLFVTLNLYKQNIAGYKK